MLQAPSRTSLATAIALLATGALPDPAADLAARIDRYLRGAEDFGFSGAVLLVQDGETVLRAGYGVADPGTGAAVTTETPFDLGSLGKQFTAAAVLALVERGDLRLDAALGDLLENVPADKAGITVHQLLTHTAGLPYHLRTERSLADVELGEFLDLVLAVPLEREPGTAFGYSNPGYNLLGAIVQRVSGRSFGEFARGALFDPAGMPTARAVGAGAPPGSPAPARSVFDGVAGDGGWSATADALGAGGVAASIADLERWLAALEAGQVLSAESVDLLFAPHVPVGSSGRAWYGYGWFRATTPRGTAVVHHAGDYNGFNVELRRYLDEGRTLAFLSNVRLREGSMREALVHPIALMAAGEEVEPPPLAVDADLTPLAGRRAGDDAGELELVPEGSRLTLRTRDPVWLERLSTGEGGRERTARWADLVAELLEGAARGNFAPARQLMHPAVVVRTDRTDLERALDSLPTGAGDPTPSLYWKVVGALRRGPPGFGSTLVRVSRGEDERAAALDLRFDWMGDRLLAVAAAEDGIELPFVATSATGATSYDLFARARLDLRWDESTGDVALLSGGDSYPIRRR